MPHEWHIYMGIEWVLNTNSVPIHSDQAKTWGNTNPLFNQQLFVEPDKSSGDFKFLMIHSATSKQTKTRVHKSNKFWLSLSPQDLHWSHSLLCSLHCFYKSLHLFTLVCTSLQVTFCNSHLFHYLLFKPASTLLQGKKHLPAANE